MKKTLSRDDEIFMAVLKRAAGNGGLSVETAGADWHSILRKAASHKLLPLVLDSLIESEIETLPEKELKPYRDSAVQSAIREIIKTKEFLTLIRHLQEKGLDPVVVKGIACRELYSKPMLRPSVDEDLVIAREDARRADELLIAEGLFRDDPADTHVQAVQEDAAEFSYHRSNSPTYIELHIDLFPEDSNTFKGWNAFFAGAMARAVSLHVEDVTLRTFAPTDHILFLILHAFEHFVHSGVGVRHILDISLYLNRFGNKIDWDYLAVCCRSARAYVFAAAILRIGEKYLGLDSELANIPQEWLRAGADETDLIIDILNAGDLGTNDINRLHSSRVTLSAAENASGSSSGFLRAVFPSRTAMERRYSFLKKHPVLLPYAWMKRIISYLGSSRRSRQVDPAESVRIGRERVALLKKYEIIE